MGITVVLDQLVSPTLNETVKSYLQVQILECIAKFNDDFMLRDKAFAVRDSFTIADCFLYTALKRAAVTAAVDLDHFPALIKYYTSIAERDDIKAAEQRMESNPATTVDDAANDCPGDKCFGSWLCPG